VKPKLLKYWPITPPIMPTGRNTATIEKVVATTGEADLVGGVDRRLIGDLAHPHVPDDILDLDDRVVDQHAGHQAQREQGHPVQGEAHHLHEPEGRDRRERDGDRRDQRRPPVAQEQEDDEDRERRALDQASIAALYTVSVYSTELKQLGT
jgi:hypothetical protein